jgi:hypothetical protein
MYIMFYKNPKLVKIRADNLPKFGQVVDPGADLLGQTAVFKTELPYLAEGGDDQTELQLKGNAAAAW